MNSQDCINKQVSLRGSCKTIFEKNIAFKALNYHILVLIVNFFAQFKYSELQYRLRALNVAETETLRALELATNSWELAQARHQLSEIRRMKGEGAIKPTWTKSLAIPVICFGLILGIIAVLFRVI